MSFPLLQVEHARLKKITKRIQDADSLISFLQAGGSMWPVVTPSGCQVLTSLFQPLEEIATRLHEIWMAQLEMRELFKIHTTPEQLLADVVRNSNDIYTYMCFSQNCLQLEMKQTRIGRTVFEVNREMIKRTTGVLVYMGTKR